MNPLKICFITIFQSFKVQQLNRVLSKYKYPFYKHRNST